MTNLHVPGRINPVYITGPSNFNYMKNRSALIPPENCTAGAFARSPHLPGGDTDRIMYRIYPLGPLVMKRPSSNNAVLCLSPDRELRRQLTV